MVSARIEQRTAINLSISFINAYCRKDLSWIPPHLDERTIFIGPRQGQFLNGGTDLTNAWIPSHPLPDFTVSDITASSVATGPMTCEVVLHYNVSWHKADGVVLLHPQIMQISWFLSSSMQEKASDRYKVAVMHISNPQNLDERDLVYNTFGDIGTSTIASSGLPSVNEKTRTDNIWIMIHGMGGMLSRYPANSILWIESASKGKRSIVHARDRDIHCIHRIHYFMENDPGIFLQPSVSYLVNPLYIKSITRFQAELWNGKILRIPEKKYTAFKKEFEAFFRKAAVSSDDDTDAAICHSEW